MAVEPGLEFSTHADPMDKGASSPAGLGARGWLRWIWARMTSMRTALLLLLLLGVAAIPGSLFPQRTSDPMAVSAYIKNNPTLAPWLERFGLFDVYGSAWFSAVYLLLFISLVGCLIPRARQHVRMWRTSPSAPPSALARMPGSINVDSHDPETVLAAAQARLRTQRWRVRTGEGWVAAEKGFWRENGNQIFHFALLGVLAAVGLGALFGWNGKVVVVEGGGFSNTLTQYDTFTSGRFSDPGELPPFSVRLRDFDVQFERGEAQRGAPRDFAADVLVSREPGAPAEPAAFGVNDPLEVDGAKVFLLGHGYAPEVRVTDARGRVVFDDAVVFLPQDSDFTSSGVIKVPDAQPQLGFRGLFLPTAFLDQVRGPISLFPAPDAPGLYLSAFTGDLGLDSGQPQNVYQLDDGKMTKVGLKSLAVGDSWELPDGAGTVEFTGYKRWISVKVAHDPGGPWALGFIGLAILGLALSLTVRRRRIWVAAGDRRVTVGGVARGDRGPLTDELTDLAASLQSDGTSQATAQQNRSMKGTQP